MNKLCKPSYLPVVTLSAGCLGLALRIWLFLGGTDEKGLLLSSHPANALIFILTALFLGYLFFWLSTTSFLKLAYNVVSLKA